MSKCCSVLSWVTSSLATLFAGTGAALSGSCLVRVALGEALGTFAVLVPSLLHSLSFDHRIDFWLSPKSIGRPSYRSNTARHCPQREETPRNPSQWPCSLETPRKARAVVNPGCAQATTIDSSSAEWWWLARGRRRRGSGPARSHHCRNEVLRCLGRGRRVCGLCGDSAAPAGDALRHRMWRRWPVC